MSKQGKEKKAPKTIDVKSLWKTVTPLTWKQYLVIMKLICWVVKSPYKRLALSSFLIAGVEIKE